MIFHILTIFPEIFSSFIETGLLKKAIEKNLPIQPGDVPITYADIDDLSDYIGFKPSTSIEDGISKFVNWYKEFYKI